MKTMNGTSELEHAYITERSGMLAWLAIRVDREEAEDILQDVMLRAFTRLDALEPVRDLGAWLWRSLRNGVIDAWRTRKRRKTASSPVDELDLLVDRAFRGVEDELERAEVIEALYEAIDSLPAEQKEVIVAQSLLEETFSSISKRTGVPVETLSARKRRALANLASNLKEYFYE